MIVAGIVPWLLTRWEADDQPLALKILGGIVLGRGRGARARDDGALRLPGSWHACAVGSAGALRRARLLPFRAEPDVPRRAPARRRAGAAPRPGDPLRVGSRRLADLRASLLFWEEPGLRRRFGDDYEDYTAARPPLDAYSSQKPSILTASPGPPGAPIAIISTPSGPARKPRGVSFATRIASHGPSSWIRPAPSTSTLPLQDEEDLFLRLVRVPPGHGQVRREPLVGEPDQLGLERDSCETRLELRREAEVRRLVLDFFQVDDRVFAHGADHLSLVQSEGNAGAPSVAQEANAAPPRELPMASRS